MCLALVFYVALNAFSSFATTCTSLRKRESLALLCGLAAIWLLVICVSSSKLVRKRDRVAIL